MTQIRYIAMHPIFKRDIAEEIVRDEQGQAVVIGWRVPSLSNTDLFSKIEWARKLADRHKRDDGGAGRVLAVDLDELPDADVTVEQQYQFAERQMIRWAAEHGRLADIVHGREIDKRDRDYYVRVKRNAEWKAHATTELRRLLEMFKPPEYVIVVERDKVVHGWKDGQPDVRTWPFVVVLRDPRPDGSDAHIFTRGETEGAAYASMLETLLAGRGFFPGM